MPLKGNILIFGYNLMIYRYLTTKPLKSVASILRKSETFSTICNHK